jgi:hypothetical protein
MFWGNFFSPKIFLKNILYLLRSSVRIELADKLIDLNFRFFKKKRHSRLKLHIVFNKITNAKKQGIF